MDTRDGTLISTSELSSLKDIERKHFIPVMRSLTAKEQADQRIKLYSPCACGSGEKFKFCCFRKTNPK